MSGWKYDVFISFRGIDTRNSFVDHLYNALEQNGIHVYRDDSELHRGEQIYHLYKAIEISRFLMVIFSENYASSSWCLRELVKILSANNSKHKVLPIFYNVKPEVVRKQTGSYAEAFAKHEVSNRAEVDEWREALTMAATFSGWDLNDMTNGYEYKFVDRISKEIRKTLSDVPLHAGIPEHKSESNYHHPCRSKRRLAILWDMENCCIPNGVRPEDVSGNILAFLRCQTEIEWEVVMFSAYADFSNFSQKIREGCRRAGVKLIDVPNGSKDASKDASGKAILADLFLYALDNPPPSSIMLISGDVGFSNALHVLRQRRYPVILVIPSRVGVLPALSNAATNIWDWSNVVRGEGPVPTSKSQIKENSDAVNKEESIESVGVSMGSQPSSEYKPDDVMRVQPGDLTSLKGQLVKLLESSGGCLRLVCLASEYRKSFKKPLRVSDYKAPKLVDLLKKISDMILVEGRGQEKVVILKK